MARLQAGANVALVSDAGTPLLSDPGFRLVRACRAAGIAVSPVPGPCAPITALSASGIAPIPFLFLGFLPRGDKARTEIFARFASTGATLVFFERRDRLEESLKTAYSILGNRPCAVCRELTKIYEEFRLGSLGDAAALCQNLLGELTIIIGPPDYAEITDIASVLDLLNQARQAGLKPREAARRVKTQTRGYGARELYELLIAQEREQ